MFHSLCETNCAILLGFVQRLTNTSPIVDQKTTMDHDFDLTTVVTRATLGTIVEDTIRKLNSLKTINDMIYLSLLSELLMEIIALIG